MTPPLLCLCAALAASPPEGEAPPAWQPEGVAVEASAGPTRVTVGDRILYTLVISVPKGLEVTPPALGQKIGDFHIREMGREQAARKEGKEEHRFLYDLRVYETGEKLIPPLAIAVRDDKGRATEVDGGSISVAVESVLDVDPKDIKDIKPPLALAYIPVALLAWLGAGAALAVVAVILVARRRRPKEERKPPPPPPHVIAYDELRRLLGMNLIARGLVMEYYVRISWIVRRYIERRFGLRAPERTTEEFLAEAAASGRLDVRARTLVGDFLEKCDMVKFAKYGPTGDENEGAYASAKRFVDETKEEPAEARNRKGGGA